MVKYYKKRKKKLIMANGNYQLRVLVLASEALEKSIEKLKSNTKATVNWTIIDESSTPEIIEQLPFQDILVTNSLNVSMREASKNLKAILLPAAGFEKIHIDAVPNGCIVANSYEHEKPISEYVFMMMTALDRDLINLNQDFKGGNWNGWPQFSGPYNELFSRELCVLGLGRIGRQVVKIGNALGMKCNAIDIRDVSKEEKHNLNLQKIVKPPEMLSVLSKIDFLVISVPLNDETKNMIGEKELINMKPSSFIINPARGPIVNEEHLFRALKYNNIAGAAIDTWYKYPKNQKDQIEPSSYPFKELTNVIMTPHISGATKGTFDRRMLLVAQNIDRVANNQNLINIIPELSKTLS